MRILLIPAQDQTYQTAHQPAQIQEIKINEDLLQQGEQADIPTSAEGFTQEEFYEDQLFTYDLNSMSLNKNEYSQ